MSDFMFVVVSHSSMRKAPYYLHLNKGVHVWLRRRKGATQMTLELARHVAKTTPKGDARLGEVWIANVWPA